jgi:hypothetical protein
VTIRKGQEWGSLGAPPAGAVEARTDAELRAIVESFRRDGRDIPPVMLLGGDLMRSAGGTGVVREVALRAPIDVVRVEAAGETAWFVAHLVARRSWWRGEVAAAMNAQFRGGWDVAPRSHPNDGRVDVLRVPNAMSVRQRLAARPRLAQGTHVPHPAIEVRQVRVAQLSFRRPLPLWLDGSRWRTSSEVTLTVEPDALTIVV